MAARFDITPFCISPLDEIHGVLARKLGLTDRGATTAAHVPGVSG